ncbi:MAG: TIGR03546 family protein [Planctomycetes bacterium]|nr:TIGR03546 family protein [Planctomycetota bacterium]
MFFLQLTRRFYKLLQSNATPHEVALGFVLGMCLGLLPAGNLGTTVLFVGLVLFLRCALSAVFFGLFVFKALYVAGAYKVCHALGEKVLEDLGEGVKGVFFDGFRTPGVAMLSLQKHIVTGGIVAAILLAGPVYLAMRWLANFVRDRYLERLKKSRVFNAITSFWAVKALKHVFIG